MSENLSQALLLMGQGMLGIFVVLGVIALMVMLMQKLEQRRSDRQD